MCSNQSTVNKTIILLGSREVGKSTILNRYVKNRYQEAYKETIGNKLDNIQVLIISPKKF
jgi:GTPase SAR1 family protein